MFTWLLIAGGLVLLGLIFDPDSFSFGGSGGGGGCDDDDEDYYDEQDAKRRIDEGYDCE